MNILFITQENYKRPSGVKTVINTLCREWLQKDRITILINKRHQGFLSLNDELFDKVDIVRIPILLPTELMNFMQFDSSYSGINIVNRIIVKFLLLVYPIFFIPYIAFWMRKRKIGAVVNHNGGWPGGELNRWSAAGGRFAMIKRNILVFHSMPVTYRKVFRPVLIIRDRFINFCCSDLVTVSNACKEDIQKKTGFSRQLHVIYNGICILEPAIDNTRPAWRKDFPVISFFGGLEFFKGVHVLIESLKYVKNPCELVLFGNGDNEYIKHLKCLSSYSKWKVHFLGFEKNALTLYQWVDIVALMSIEYESFGMTLLEGMMWSKPIVCSDFGGMKEIVDDGKSGYIVEANNAKELAKSIDKLLIDKKLREAMGNNGRKKLEKCFNASLMVSNYKLLIDHELTTPNK